MEALSRASGADWGGIGARRLTLRESVGYTGASLCLPTLCFTEFRILFSPEVSRRCGDSRNTTLWVP